MTSTASDLPTTRYENRVLLVCGLCTSNNKPRLVWMENGYLCFGGSRKIRYSLVQKVYIGRCERCNREWHYP